MNSTNPHVVCDDGPTLEQQCVEFALRGCSLADDDGVRRGESTD